MANVDMLTGEVVENNGAPAKLVEALAKAKLEFEAIIKDKVADYKTNMGSRVNYKYASYNAIKDACDPALSKHGLAITHRVAIVDGSPVFLSTLMHESGEQLPPNVFPIADLDQVGHIKGLQAKQAQYSYLRKYAYCCILDLAAEDDDDANMLRGATEGQGGQPSSAGTAESYRSIGDLKTAIAGKDGAEAKLKELTGVGVRQFRMNFLGDHTLDHAPEDLEQYLADLRAQYAKAKRDDTDVENEASESDSTDGSEAEGEQD